MKFGNNFLIVFILLGCLRTYSSAQFRIRDGTRSNIKDSPYMVSLHNNFSYFCSGGLIKLHTVITAAHCLMHNYKEDIKVLAGVTDLRHAGYIRNVQDVFIPDTYSVITQHMDIGLLKLCTPFKRSDTIKAIRPCGTKLRPGMELRFSGWGKKNEKKGYVYNLRTAVVPVLPKEKCINLYSYFTKAMICAGGDKSDTCEGDSGAPGVTEGQLCAVVSTGKGCAHRLPTIYTYLSDREVRSFIKESMQRN